MFCILFFILGGEFLFHLKYCNIKDDLHQLNLTAGSNSGKGKYFRKFRPEYLIKVQLIKCLDKQNRSEEKFLKKLFDEKLGSLMPRLCIPFLVIRVVKLFHCCKVFVRINCPPPLYGKSEYKRDGSQKFSRHLPHRESEFPPPIKTRNCYEFEQTTLYCKANRIHKKMATSTEERKALYSGHRYYVTMDRKLEKNPGKSYVDQSDVVILTMSISQHHKCSKNRIFRWQF